MRFAGRPGDVDPGAVPSVPLPEGDTLMTDLHVAEARRRIDHALECSRTPVMTCSFQPGGLVVLHLLGAARHEVPVLFVDTGYHFGETLEFKDRMIELWGLNVRIVRPADDVQRHEANVGRLHRTNADLCCAQRKTGPLFEALAGHDAWLTGLRRDQAESRRATGVVERRVLPDGSVLSKANPIVDWTAAELEAYMERHEIPVHPLIGQGFPSIGCAPCTNRPSAADDDRSGRWAGTKTECGLHTRLDPVASLR